MPKTSAVLAFVLLGIAWISPREARAQAQDTAPVSTEARAAAKEAHVYKNGESWPLRVFEGPDFLEPFLPLAAIGRQDVGRILLNTMMPASVMASAFIFEHTDNRTIHEIQKWTWLGFDDKSDNYDSLYGFIAIAGLSSFLPSPEDKEGGYSFGLRLDRLTVFALGEGFAALEPEILKPMFNKVRPNGTSKASRPSGHAASAGATAAYLSDILRDTFRPQDESNPVLRVLEELASAVPYVGAAYISLSRVENNKHFLTDVMLGGSLGALTMHLFYSWSFTKVEEGRGWIDLATVWYNKDRRALEFALVKRF